MLMLSPVKPKSSKMNVKLDNNLPTPERKSKKLGNFVEEEDQKPDNLTIFMEGQGKPIVSKPIKTKEPEPERIVTIPKEYGEKPATKRPERMLMLSPMKPKSSKMKINLDNNLPTPERKSKKLGNVVE